MGNPGPGVFLEHLQELQLLANDTGVGVFIHGSRQTGFSVHTGKAFAVDADLDIGVIGEKKELVKLLRGNWQNIPNVVHAPMRLLSLDKALQNNFVVILPQEKNDE